jgi:hypothetical protein
MSDWQVGDLALCIHLSDIHPFWRARTRFREGEVYRVDGLVNGRFGELYLVIGAPDIFAATGYPNAGRFRKIRPDEHEACEPEFVTLLKRTKRTVAA